MIPTAAAFGFVLLLAFISQGMERRSMLALSTEERARLVEAAARISRAWPLLMGTLLIVCCGLLYLYTSLAAYIAVGLFVGFFVLAASANYSSFQKLKQAGLPPSFLKTFLVSRSLRMAGAAALLITASCYVLGTVAA